MEAVLEPLLASPKLVIYYQQLDTVLNRERRKRQQFYDTMTEQQKVEFINGEMIVQSPVKLEHDFVSNNLNVLLRMYVLPRRLGYVGHEKLLVSLTRNDYEPDVCFWGNAKADRFEHGQVHFPAPDFVAEVLSPSTAVYDREIKFDDYAAHGVQEYWILDPAADVVEQYVLQGEEYALVQKTDSGVLRCQAVPGFHVPVAALFDEQEHLKYLNTNGETPLNG